MVEQRKPTEKEVQELIEAIGEPGQHVKNVERSRQDEIMLDELTPGLIRKGRKIWVAVFEQKIAGKSKTLDGLNRLLRRKGIYPNWAARRLIDPNRAKRTVIVAAA